MSYTNSIDSPMVCLDRCCPKVFDPHTNMVMCRCHQVQTSPTSQFPTAAPSHLHPGSPPSLYPGSMQYGENQAVPPYPCYPGYSSGYDYSMYQSAFQQQSPGIPGTDLSMYNSYQALPYGHPAQMEQMLRTQVNEYLNYQHLSAQVNGNDIPATKQSTKVLKTWMKEHKKNPYPTKTEKVMLAFATRMTMTQISNWFANARRRMKQQKDKGNTSDGALSDISDDDDKSNSPVSDRSSHVTDESPSPPSMNLSEFIQERDMLMAKVNPAVNITETEVNKITDSTSEGAVPRSNNTTISSNQQVSAVSSSPKKSKIWSVSNILG